jgi:hypothetical protein
MSVLAEIIEGAPSLHRAGTFSTAVLNSIVHHASAREIVHSAETGSGTSTLLFSHLSKHHTVFALDDGTDSLRAVQRSPFLRPGVVVFVEGPTQITLPAHSFDNKLQLVLIDGPHAYPFPDLEYYYVYDHLDENALFIIDDIHIRSVNNLFEFLRADDMFELSEVVENTAFFRRTSAPAFPRLGDDWLRQGYNRRDFEVVPAVPGESDRLEKESGIAAFYLDELGSTKNPGRWRAPAVAAGEPLLVSGWGIDERHQVPARWIELVLDGTPYRTEARVPRGDVASARRHFDYLRCGFRATLPSDRMTRGNHTLVVRIVLANGRSYHESAAISFTAQ